tara:strand:- start:597 stop:761 length:165 start_codon:yes stop_codon:yes gene_type:complete
MFSITVTNINQVAAITQTQTATYTSDERASLDQVGIVCEYLVNMVLEEFDGEQE